VELLRAAGFFEIALHGGKYVAEVLCQKWPWLARIRDWVKNVAGQPAGKAIGKQAGITLARWLDAFIDWLRRQLAEGTNIFAREPS
jgi:hypothetical protein